MTWLDQATFTQHWSGLHRSLFAERQLAASPFRASDWSLGLLSGGLSLTPADLVGLGKITAASDTVIVLDPTWAFPERAAFAFRWAPETFEHLNVDTPLGHLETHVFPGTGQWALVANPEGVGILGAPTNQFAAFADAVGGLDALKARYAAEEYGIGFGDAGALFRRELRTLVAWEAA
jgi:hypothetical protein